jgi:hypothetical protein
VRTFWPVAEPAQADYEELRAAVLAGSTPAVAAWLRFGRHGLAGLIAAPVSAPVFTATVEGAMRPAWSPHLDPRDGVLAAVYATLVVPSRPVTEEIAQ